MSAAAKAATVFDLCGGHPALDFVNSLDNRYRDDGPNEMLVSYGDLLRFLEESALLDPQRVRSSFRRVAPEMGEKVLQSARVLREATAAVLYASLATTCPPPATERSAKESPAGATERSAKESPAGADLRILEKYFLEAGKHRELRAPRPTEASLAWTWGRFESEPELPVWMLAQSVSDLLLSEQMARVSACGVDTCRWLFLDTSKNHTRRWCNMKVCGNRVKARRFQAARRET